MERERGYSIMKLSDMEKYLSEDEIETLMTLDSKVSFCRQQDDRGILRGMVIEADWPEFEPAWKMIEDRVDGVGTNA